MELSHIILGSLVVPVISWGTTIVKFILQREKESTEAKYFKLYAEGEVSILIDKSRALCRKNSPIRNDSTESIFDILTLGESIPEGERINE